MASLGCFIHDTQIRDDLHEVMTILAAINIEEGKQFTVRDAYRHFADNKIEVDLESVASIYEDTFDLNDGNYNTQQEVADISGQTFTSILNNLALMQPANTYQITGQVSAGKKAANMIAGIFRNAMVTDVKTQSVMKQFEKMIERAARRVVDKSELPPAKKAATRTFDEILSDAFSIDETGIRNLSGSLNSSEQVWNEFENEVQRYQDELNQSGASRFTKDQFKIFSGAIIGKGYDLLLSQKESSDIIKGALIDAGYFREVKRKGKTVKILDWKKLTEATGSMKFLRQNVTTVLQAQGYKDAQIERINSALESEYIALRASIILKANAARELKMLRQKAANTPLADKKRTINPKSFAEKLARVLNDNPLSESRENAAVRLIREALISEGFYRDAKINGVLKKVIDWNKVVKAGISAADIKNVFSASLQAQGYSDTQVTAINTAMAEDFMALIKAQKDTRLARLKKANSPAIKIVRAKVVKTFEELLEKALLNEKDAQGRVAAAKKIINDVLIDKGFFSERVVNGVATRFADWKKLAQQGVDGQGMADMFGASLDNAGYSEYQIQAIIKSLQADFDSMDADIKEKGLKELARRNKLSTPIQKTNAKRLAELYAYGLFDQTPDLYAQVLNGVLGMSDIDQATFAKLKVFGKALQTLYSTKLNGNPVSEAQLKTASASISAMMGSILRKNQSSNSMILKIARTLQSVTDAAMRFVLTGLKNQGVQNPLSGKFAKITAAIQVLHKTETTPELRAQNRKLVKAVFKDMVYEGGLHYGDLNTTLINRGRLDEVVNNVTTNKAYHLIAGTLIGRVGLDAMDSRFKASLVDKYLIHNLLKVLTSDTNPNRMSQEDALKEVSEALTGTSYAEAETAARNTIANINKNGQILNTSDAYVTRLANDIVKAQLMSRGTVTEDQINAAYNAAYKAAGRDLGHVPNNPVSEMVGSVNNKIQSELEDALKKRQYPKAAWLTLSQIVFRSFMNPFVGGGTNWIVLKIEKSGIGLATGLLSKQFRVGNKGNINLATDAGMKELEQDLYEQQRAANKMYRGATGAAASLLMTGIIWAALKKAFPDDDEEKRRARMHIWRKNNRWLSKYTDEFSPEWLLAYLYGSQGEGFNYVNNLMGWNDNFSAVKLFQKGGALMQTGDVSEGWGKMGEAVGTKLNAPVPYQLVRDIVTLGKGFGSWIPEKYTSAIGLEPMQAPKYEYIKSRGLWQGFLKRGVYESLGGKVNPDWTLDALPGVSGATVKQLEGAGVKNMQDLKKYKGNLINLHGKDINGKRVLIFNKNERREIDEILKTVK